MCYIKNNKYLKRKYLLQNNKKNSVFVLKNCIVVADLQYGRKNYFKKKCRFVIKSRTRSDIRTKKHILKTNSTNSRTTSFNIFTSRITRKVYKKKRIETSH